jgi:hypothetical protein
VPSPRGIHELALDKPRLAVVDEPNNLYFESGHPEDASEAAEREAVEWP